MTQPWEAESLMERVLRFPLGACEAGRGHVATAAALSRAQKKTQQPFQCRYLLLHTYNAQGKCVCVRVCAYVCICLLLKEKSQQRLGLRATSLKGKQALAPELAPSTPHPQLLATTAYSPLCEIQLVGLVLPFEIPS